MGFVAHMLEIKTHLAMMSTLIKRWHSETSSFHLPIGEATITLEDFWCILWVSIHGEWVIYDVDVGMATCYEVLGVDTLQVETSKIDLQDYKRQAPDLTLVIGALICGVLMLDRWGRGFNIDWGLAQGLVILASLYHNMHQVIYMGGQNIGAGVTLLHI